MEKVDEVNQYKCQDCDYVITTVNAHDGTTPMFLGCRSPEECGGLMASGMYRVPRDAEPDYVWYKPDADEEAKLDAASLGHVKQGGLLLRVMSEEENAQFGLRRC